MCRRSSAAQARRQPTVVYNEREVVNGLMYVLSTGCQWRRQGPCTAFDALRLLRSLWTARSIAFTTRST